VAVEEPVLYCNMGPVFGPMSNQLKHDIRDLWQMGSVIETDQRELYRPTHT